MGNRSYPVHPLAVDALLHTANSVGPFAAHGQTSESFLSPLSSRFAVLNDADSEQDASSSLQPPSAASRHLLGSGTALFNLRK